MRTFVQCWPSLLFSFKSITITKVGLATVRNRWSFFTIIFNVQTERFNCDTCELPSILPVVYASAVVEWDRNGPPVLFFDERNAVPVHRDKDEVRCFFCIFFTLIFPYSHRMAYFRLVLAINKSQRFTLALLAWLSHCTTNTMQAGCEKATVITLN
jgi:hypothetical protein